MAFHSINQLIALGQRNITGLDTGTRKTEGPNPKSRSPDRGFLRTDAPGHPLLETRTPHPLIKSQGQRGPEPNIDKKAQLFRGAACFFFDNGWCMFCPGSGTKQAQSCVRREREMNKRKLGSFVLCAMLFALCQSAEAQQPTKV